MTSWKLNWSSLAPDRQQCTRAICRTQGRSRRHRGAIELWRREPGTGAPGRRLLCRARGIPFDASCRREEPSPVWLCHTAIHQKGKGISTGLSARRRNAAPGGCVTMFMQWCMPYVKYKYTAPSEPHTTRLRFVWRLPNLWQHGSLGPVYSFVSTIMSLTRTLVYGSDGSGRRRTRRVPRSDQATSAAGRKKNTPKN